MFDVFIISPYRDDNITVESGRAMDADLYVGELAQNGVVAYSTISAMHHLLGICDLPSDWEFWKTHCSKMIACAKEVHVLKLDGWETSEGVAGELDLAKILNKPIKFIDMVYTDD